MQVGYGRREEGLSLFGCRDASADKKFGNRICSSAIGEEFFSLFLLLMGERLIVPFGCHLEGNLIREVSVWSLCQVNRRLTLWASPRGNKQSANI